MERNKVPTLPFCQVPIIHPAIFADDCSGTYRYSNYGTGADFSSAYDINASFSKLKGILLATKTTAPAFNDYVQAIKTLWYPANKHTRLQLLFSVFNAATSEQIQFQISVQDGTNIISAQIQLGTPDTWVALLTGPGSYTQIPNARWTDGFLAWNYLDLSVNFNTGSYHSIALNHQLYDLHTYPLYTTASALPPCMQLSLQLITKEANIAKICVAEILITPELR